MNEVTATATEQKLNLGRVLLLVAASLVFASSVVFSNEEEVSKIGFSPNHVYEGALKGENVDIMTGNVTLEFPIGPRYQVSDSFGYQVKMYFNSKGWEHIHHSQNLNTCGELTHTDQFGHGFLLHFGRIYKKPNHHNELSHIYHYETPSGATHVLCRSDTVAECPTDITKLEGLNLVGSSLDRNLAYEYVVSSNEYRVYPGDGTKLTLSWFASAAEWATTKIESIASPSQNVVISYNNAYPLRPTKLTDSLQREIFISESGVSVPAESGAVDYDFEYLTVNLDDPKGGLCSSNTEGNNRKLLEKIKMPAASSGEPRYEHSFGWDENLILDTGLLTSWTLPTGAKVRYEYATHSTSSDRPLHQFMMRRHIDANGQTYSWTYGRFDGAISPELINPFNESAAGQANLKSNPSHVRVWDPDGNLSVHTFSYTSCDGGCVRNWNASLPLEVFRFAGPFEDSSRLVEKATYSHTFDGETGGSDWVKTGVGNTNLFTRETDTPVGVRASSSETIRYAGLQSARVKSQTANWSSGTFYRVPTRIHSFNNGELAKVTKIAAEPTKELRGGYTSKRIEDPNGIALLHTDARFEGNRKLCDVRRSVAPAPDSNGDFPTLGTCDLSQILVSGSGDVATVNTFDATTGNLTSSLVSGGDGGLDKERIYTYTNGMLETLKFASNSWNLAERDVDPNTGRILSSTDSLGVTTEYDWDDLGRLTQIRPPAPEKPVIISYVDLVTTKVTQEISSGNKIETIYKYDDLGRLIRQERRNATGGTDVQLTEYDIGGRVIAQSVWAPDGTAEANLDWTTYEYNSFTNPNAGGSSNEPPFFTDPLGRVSKVTKPDGSMVLTRYNGLETEVETVGVEGVSGPVNSVTRYVNDDLGRLVHVDSPGDGADANYEYDVLDRLIEVELVDPAQPATDPTQHRYFTYDLLGRLRWAAHPESGVTQYVGYDASGKLLSFLDARGNLFENTYDSLGRLIKRTVENATTLDPNDPNATMALPVVENTYDSYGGQTSNGQLLYQKSSRIWNGVSEETSTRTWKYGDHSSTACSEVTSAGGTPAEDSYSGLNGRLASVTQTIAPWTQSMETHFCFNTLGLPTYLGYPDESSQQRTIASLEHRYSNGQLDALVDLHRDVTHLGDIYYDATGAIVSHSQTNGMRLVTDRDEMSRPLNISVRTPNCDPSGTCVTSPWESGDFASVWESGAYTYDGAGNISAIGVDNYRYDELNRLVSAGVDKNAFGTTYAYDAFGNMLSRQVTGNLVETKTFSVDRKSESSD